VQGSRRCAQDGADTQVTSDLFLMQIGSYSV
jgi:hypothetical protein